jgi:hypothetical protein
MSPNPVDIVDEVALTLGQSQRQVFFWQQFWQRPARALEKMFLNSEKLSSRGKRQ